MSGEQGAESGKKGKQEADSKERWVALCSLLTALCSPLSAHRFINAL